MATVNLGYRANILTSTSGRWRAHCSVHIYNGKNQVVSSATATSLRKARKLAKNLIADAQEGIFHRSMGSMTLATA